MGQERNINCKCKRKGHTHKAVAIWVANTLWFAPCSVKPFLQIFLKRRYILYARNLKRKQFTYKFAAPVSGTYTPSMLFIRTLAEIILAKGNELTFFEFAGICEVSRARHVAVWPSPPNITCARTPLVTLSLHTWNCE
jgi:hypothetical protein